MIHSCSMDEEQDIQVVLETESKDLQNGDQSNIYVFITGCVAKPSVYEIAEGTRLYELVELAGGFTEDADQDYLNLAEVLSDGEKITVYSIEETMQQTVEIGNTETAENNKINLNTADKETLMTLPGIGESKAQAIIKYREENGAFSKIEDVMNVSGIKGGAFDKIKDLIKV